MLSEAASKKTVLIVDDAAENRTLIMGLLKDEYRVLAAVSGMQALELCERFLPDMVLLDIVMPVMDGYEVCYQLKNNPKTESIPVIFLTAKSRIEDEQKGFDAGAVDYILKPVSPPILLARVKTHLQLRVVLDELKDKTLKLEKTVKERTDEVEILKEATVSAMASLADTRDTAVGNHVLRTQKYVGLLADQLAENPKYEGESVSKIIEDLSRFSSCRQEKWDGSGYPENLAGIQIPLSARLMAVADVYDALILSRVYKPSFPHSKAVGIIVSLAGTHFDPDVIEAFKKVEKYFVDIADEFSDEIT